MNLFVIHSGADRDAVSEKLSELKRKCFALNPLMLENGGPLWKLDAAKKIKKAQMVLFLWERIRTKVRISRGNSGRPGKVTNRFLRCC